MDLEILSAAIRGDYKSAQKVIDSFKENSRSPLNEWAKKLEFVYLSDEDLQSNNVNLSERMTPNEKTTRVFLIQHESNESIQVIQQYEYTKK